LEKHYYSDFMIDFKEKFDRTYKNVTNIKIKIREMPDLRPMIDDTCNKLTIITNSETKKIELTDGYYELDELLNDITENMEDVDIICKKDKKGRVIFENTRGEDFELNCEDCSFGKYLGFCEEKYMSDSKYISENISQLSINKIYLYLLNISDNVFCTIDNDNKIKMMTSQNKIEELDCLIIQVKDLETSDEQHFHDFSGNKFELVITFECDCD